MTYTYIWAFEVRAEHVEAFRRYYGEGGAWMQLFRRARGYVGTQLLQDESEPLRFVTIDTKYFKLCRGLRFVAQPRTRQEKGVMPAKRDVAVRIGMILLPGLLYAMPAASEGDRDSRRASSPRCRFPSLPNPV